MRSILMCIARMLSAFWRSSRIFIIFLLKCDLCAEITLTSATHSLYFFHRWFHWSLWYCAIAMLSLVEIVKKKKRRLHLDCIFASSWMKTFRSTIFLMMSEREMMQLTFVKRARISSHACLISCVRSSTRLCSMILFCNMFRWICSELVYVSVSKVSMFTLLNTSATWRRIWFWSVSSLHFLLNSSFIENMLYTLHATYIEHDLYADFPLRLEKLLREFSRDRFTVQDERDFSLLRFQQFTS